MLLASYCLDMTLLHKYLPKYDFSERHAIEISAPAEQVIAAVTAYRPEHDPFFRFAIGLREFPNRLVTYAGRQSDKANPPFSLDNFTMLELRGSEEVVYGLAGKFWRLDYGQEFLKDAEAFVAYQRLGTARLLLGYMVQTRPNGVSYLQTETRVQCLDEEALKNFRPYWYLIRPVSGLIRMRMLKAIRHAAVNGT